MIVKYRSRLMGLPVEVREGLAEVSYQIGMTPSARKERCVNVLKNHNIPFNDVGTGTNRFIIRYDGYVIKLNWIVKVLRIIVRNGLCLRC